MVISAAHIFAFIFFISKLCDFNPGALFRLAHDTGLLINLGLPTTCVVSPLQTSGALLTNLLFTFEEDFGFRAPHGQCEDVLVYLK